MFTRMLSSKTDEDLRVSRNGERDVNDKAFLVLFAAMFGGDEGLC